MPWLLPLILFSIPVYTVSFLASRRGNLLVTLAALAVALVFWLAVVLAWVPGLAQSGKGTIWAASLVGLCLGNAISVLARRRQRWNGTP